MDELRRVAVTRSAVLPLLQEPYSVRGTFNALSIIARIIHGPAPPSERYGLPSSRVDSPRAVIAIYNRACDVLAIPEFCDYFFAVAQVALTPSLRAFFISAYFPSSAVILPFINRLNLIVSSLDTRFPIIIGGDVNAQWSGQYSNTRGSLLADFVTGWDLVTLNDPLLGPTFSSPNGNSFIDISAVSGPFASRCSNWSLDYHIVPSSDHASILFNIKTDPTKPSQLAADVPMLRLNTFVAGDSTDWRRFHDLLSSGISSLELAITSPPADLDAI